MTTNKQINKQAGMTLIELLIGVGLFAVLVTLTMGFSIDTWQTYGAIREETAVQVALTDSADRIRSLLLSATALPASTIIQGTIYTASQTTLIATVPSIAADGSQITGFFDTIVVTQTDQGLLQKIEPAGGTREPTDQLLLGSELTSVLFTITQPSGSQRQTTLTMVFAAKAVLLNRTQILSVDRLLVLRNLD